MNPTSQDYEKLARVYCLARGEDPDAMETILGGIQIAASLMKTLTIDAVWAWAIVSGPKRVENRTWATTHRGPLAIHAGRNRSREVFARAELARLGVEVPEEVPRGVILGTVDLVDCVSYFGVEDPHNIGEDPFATGPVCWILRDPKPLPEPIPAVGGRGLWKSDKVTR